MRLIAMLFVAALALGCSSEAAPADVDAGKRIADYPCQPDGGDTQCWDFSLQAACRYANDATQRDAGYFCSIDCSPDPTECHKSGGACYQGKCFPKE